ATFLRIEAGSYAGTGANHLETAVQTLSAVTAAGGLFVTETNALAVDRIAQFTANRVAADGTATVAAATTDLAQEDLAVAGDLVLTTVSGALMIEGGSDTAAVSAAGNILLAANETAEGLQNDSDITVNAGIESSGMITVTAADTISQNSDLAVSSGAGSITLTASAGITMSYEASSLTQDGDISYNAGGNVSLSSMNAGAGAITITAGTGDALQNDLLSALTVSVKAGNDIVMTSTAATMSQNGAVMYEAGNDLIVAIIDATGGGVTLKAGMSGEILDATEDSSVNVSADVLNFIGRGIQNRVAEADGLIMAQMKEKAIETNAADIYVASNDIKPTKLDIQIGEKATAILRDAEGWSIQFVNEGIFIPSFTYNTLNGITAPSSIYGLTDWAYAREINYQLLDHLAADTEMVRRLTPSEVQEMILFADAGQLYGRESYSESGVQFLSVLAETDDEEEKDDDPFKLDVLAVGDPSMIPNFEVAAWDADVCGNDFEYWIEDVVF
ncbi:MAG: hypothetical protein M0P57_12465, partial [Syntrophales bacterium]|nr:hypothetical protein [Syntrophales bacterium]